VGGIAVVLFKFFTFYILGTPKKKSLPLNFLNHPTDMERLLGNTYASSLSTIEHTSVAWNLAEPHKSYNASI